MRQQHRAPSSAIRPEIVKGLYYNISQSDMYDGVDCYIRLISKSSNTPESKIQFILDKITINSLKLGDDLFNVNQGIISGADKVSTSHIKKFNLLSSKGDGIFVLRSDEIDLLGFDDNEKKILKPWFKNSDIMCWHTNNIPKKYIIYSNYETIDEIRNYPKIHSYLSQYKEIISRHAYRWHDLHRSRSQSIFEGPKIVAPQRSYNNTFAYNECSWFSSADVYFITLKNSSISLHYILGILNSKLYYLWLYYRGKRKGEMLELYQVPLSEIPIKQVNLKAQNPIIRLVRTILSITKDDDYIDNPEKKVQVKHLEEKIDRLVYELYELLPEEIEIVENHHRPR